MNKSLKPEMYQLLKDVALKHQPDLLSSVELLEKKQLSAEKCFDLCEMLTAELCECGLDENDEPNERGLLIDEIIGKLSRLAIESDIN